ncbi:hypothetical protein [Flavobacterium sp.]|uniref:hypothetical protein n=1 Tax=Flavobacterium sp. TaxID=239 RepID=UPI00122074C9|nr:hypothetical protein [Flavobacterium sp.]RZJ71548.1 MAG: hypothetical protein EOO49_09315 [Flavobacterium sp.]
MIDYVKIYLRDVNVADLLNHPDLDFRGRYSSTTGEHFDYPLESDYHCCKIELLESRKKPQTVHVVFTGSIHKMWNSINGIDSPSRFHSTGFNGNPFTLADLEQTIIHLETLFGCDRGQMDLQNVEIGMNVELPFNPMQFISGLMLHRNKRISLSEDGHYAQFAHQQ